MIQVFVERKVLDNLALSFDIAVGEHNHITVYVWKSEEGLFQNTNFENKDYGGAYVSQACDNGLFGEIHLLQHRLGAGYVAHELMHFMYDWMCFVYSKQLGSLEINEPLAYLIGDVTRDFWDTIYDSEELELSPGIKK